MSARANFLEFPKWVRGRIVQNSAEEAALFHPLDHDHDGRKGGSLKRHDGETPPMTIFAEMKFPDYSFSEYPKAVSVDAKGKPTDKPYDENGKRYRQIIVQDQAESEALFDGVELVGDRVKTEDDTRAELYIEAEQSGAQIDKRWSIGKIEKAIADHKAAKSGDVI